MLSASLLSLGLLIGVYMMLWLDFPKRPRAWSRFCFLFFPAGKPKDE